MCRAFGEHGYSSRITTSNIIAFNRFHARNSSKCNTSQRWRFKHKIFHVCIPSFYANEWVQSMASTFKTKCTIHTHTHTSALARMYSPFFIFYQKNLCTEWCGIPNAECRTVHTCHAQHILTLIRPHAYLHSLKSNIQNTFMKWFQIKWNKCWHNVRI